MVDGQRYILGALSFMQDEAAEWARQYIEQASQGTILFTGSRTVFWDAFKSRFEPQDEKAEALNKLQACTQGNCQFAEFFAEFQSLASHTGFSDTDLAARLRSKLSKEYPQHMSYIVVSNTSRGPETYEELKNAGYTVDRMKDQLDQDLAVVSGKANTTASTLACAFRDPDAMDIDASNIDERFKRLTGNDLKRQFEAYMRDKCKVCGLKAHTASDPLHRESVCNHCGRKGHYSRVCRSYLEGRPAVTKPAPATICATDTASSGTTPGSSTGPDTREAEIATLRDQLHIMNKRLSDFA